MAGAISISPTDDIRTTANGPVVLHQQSAAKAWANWDGSVGTFNGSLNTTSLTDNGVGDFTVNFTSSFASASYNGAGDGEWLNAGAASNSGTLIDNRLVGACNIETSNNGTINDVNNTGFHLFGDLA